MDSKGMAGALMMASFLLVFGIVALVVSVVGGMGWLAYFLWHHLAWVP